MTVIQLSRERLMFRSVTGEHAHVNVPADLAQHVNAVMDWVESYRSPQQQAQDAILEAAFDSGKIEPEILATIARPWTEGESVNPGDVRLRDGQVYKATEKHKAAESRGSLDETGQWVVYRQEKEIIPIAREGK